MTDVAAADDRDRQGVPRRPRARRRRPRRPGRRGALPARPERRRQVHADQGALRLPPARRGHDHLGRRGGVVLHAGQGDRARRRDDLPGARPGAAPRRHRERLPRPRGLARRLHPARPGPRDGPRPARPARPRGDLADPDRRRPVAGQPADRQHGPGAVARHPAARPGRAVRRAGPGGGRQPLPGHPRASPPRASRSSTSPTASRRSARSATGSPSSRTAAPSPPAWPSPTPRPRS